MHPKSFGVNTTVLPNHSIVSLSCYLCTASNYYVRVLPQCALCGRKTASQNFQKFVSCPINLISALLIKNLLPRTANRIASFSADD